MNPEIRNFSIIAHIDHGKSTLADRLLELTHTVEKRKMRAQVLDMMELERERGITIKMAPVTMIYQLGAGNFRLNLIDTPGHVDFSYEVSRALRAVEGAVLLVDATQGVQAQTLSVLSLGQQSGLKIIGAVNKIDSPLARTDEVRLEVSRLLGHDPKAILAVSGKTGAGVPELLAAIVSDVPPPRPESGQGTRALVFDFEYSSHQGLIVYVRVFEGRIKSGDRLAFASSKETFEVSAVGRFEPWKRPSAALEAGEIGYLATGMKEFGRAGVGETIIDPRLPLPPFPGYRQPPPLVWASLYLQGRDNDFRLLDQALKRLRLSDAALSFDETFSPVLGRGFRCGFLGLLHFEIILERLRREFGLSPTVTVPSTGWELEDLSSGRREFVSSPHLFPADLRQVKVREPWARGQIVAPAAYLNVVMKLLPRHQGRVLTINNLSAERVVVDLELPLRELMRNFFDELKTLSSGFASLAYKISDYREAVVTRLEILVGGETVPAFLKIVPAFRVQEEAETAVERLKTLLPRQLIAVRIQAKALGRILASRAIPSLKKDVTGYLYGGDITRKMKLREKQKRGKKKMQARLRVRIPPEVFIKMASA